MTETTQEIVSRIELLVATNSQVGGRWGPAVLDPTIGDYNFNPSDPGGLSNQDIFLAIGRYGNWAGDAYGGGHYSPSIDLSRYRNPADAAALDDVINSYQSSGKGADPSTPVKDLFDAHARIHDLLYEEANLAAANAWRDVLEGRSNQTLDEINARQYESYREADLWWAQTQARYPASTPYGAILNNIGTLYFSVLADAQFVQNRVDALDANELEQQLASAYGSRLGQMLGGDPFTRVAEGSIAGVVGKDLANYFQHADLTSSLLGLGADGRPAVVDSFTSAIDSLGAVIDAATPQALSGFANVLLGAAAQDLHLGNFGSYVFTSAGEDLTDFLSSNILHLGSFESDNRLIDDILNSGDLNPGSIATYFADLASRYVINDFTRKILEPLRSLVDVDKPGEQYFVEAGSIAGSVVASYLFPELGPIGQEFGSVIGSILADIAFEALNFITGDWFSSLFEGKTTDGAVYVVFDPVTQHFSGSFIDHSDSDWKHATTPTVQGALAMTNAAYGFINAVIDSIGATVSLNGFFPIHDENEHNNYHGRLNNAAFGFYKDHFAVYTESKDYGFYSANDSAYLVRTGIEYEMSKLIFYGGDLLQTRAINAWKAELPNFAPGDSLGVLTAYLQIAKDYRNYLDHADTINFLIASAPQSTYALGWVATLLEIHALGLDKAYIGSPDGGAGTDANDHILTADGADLLFGNGGDDVISSYGGNDTVYGGEGNDTIDGGDGNDLIGGGEGNDTLLGGDGVDQIFGYTGNDNIDGGDGDDQLAGEDGDDTIAGGAGNDVIYGDGPSAAGNDHLFGGDGDDLIRAGSGDDMVSGGTGADQLYGDDGADTIAGDDGNDMIRGGAGDDTLSGNAGDDKILGDQGNDTISGDAGNDKLYGLDGDDTIHGGDGNDQIFGDVGADKLYGDAGDDAINGWSGADTIDGSGGNDTLAGEDGNDTITGGDGDDLIYGDRAPTATPAHSEQQIIDIVHSELGVNNFAVLYQGADYTRGGLIAAATDMLIINPASSSDTAVAQSEQLWSADDIAAIKASGKIVIGYLNVSKINDFTGEWSAAWTSTGLAGGALKGSAPDFLGGVDPSAANTRLVNFWDVDWRDTLHARIDTMIRRGFDGVFLDDVVRYFVARGDTTGDISQAARDMRDLIVDLRVFAEQDVRDVTHDPAKAAAFKFILNGAPYIIDDTTADGHAADPVQDAAFFQAIDAIVAENYFSQGQVDAIAKAAAEFGSHGIALLSVDNGLVTQEQRIDIMKAAVNAGFLPYATSDVPYDELSQAFAPGYGDNPSPGADVLAGGAGNDTIFGGDGFDAVIYSGIRLNYHIAFDTASHSFTIADQRAGTPDGTDKVTDVEQFQFADGSSTYNAVGQLIAQVDRHGDGSATESLFDSADSASWTAQFTQYDTTGSLASQRVTEDNGTVWLNTYATTAASFVWRTDNLDAAGHVLSEVVANSNGTYSLTVNDIANQYGWAGLTVTFDSAWNRTGLTGTRDDGTHSVTASDMAVVYDTLLWFATPFDANFNRAPSSVVLSGGSGIDTLYGHAGNDTLSGGAGSDYLNGGRGNDMLAGGDGVDRFAFASGDGNDTISDFATAPGAHDVIELHGYGLTNFATLQPLMSQAGGDVLIALDAENHIVLQNIALASLSSSDFAFV
ncbi:MAG: endo alpha-1,4 polygalactosaminidase [Rhizomicrobium sp.]